MKVEINRLTKRGVRVQYIHGQSLWDFDHVGQCISDRD